MASLPNIFGYQIMLGTNYLFTKYFFVLLLNYIIVMLFGVPFCVPFCDAFGVPLGVPISVPFGVPFGVHFGVPFGVPFGVL